MAEELSNKDRIRKLDEIDAAAAFTAGTIAAAKSAVRKAAHEAYNDPVAVGKRMENEAGGLDPRAEAAIAFMAEGEPEVEAREVELQILHKAVRNRMREEAGLTDAGAKAESGRAAQSAKSELDEYVERYEAAVVEPEPPAPVHKQKEERKPSGAVRQASPTGPAEVASPTGTARGKATAGPTGPTGAGSRKKDD